MKEYTLRLIAYPDFYYSFNKNGIVNFNKDFWEYIFLSKEFRKSINISKLTKLEKEEFAYILKHLEFSYKIFTLLKYKEIGIQLIIFAFNIIDSYLKIIEKFSGGFIIKFYDYFHTHTDFKFDNENNILYKFYNTKQGFFSDLVEGDTLNISINFSHQIIQLQIINNILEKLGKRIKFKIYLGSLIWFENKIEFKKKLEKQIKNIESIDILKQHIIEIRTINGNIYHNLTLFGTGCSWRKCSFCNIGKFNQTYKGNNLEDRVNELIKFINQNQLKYINISDPSIEFEHLLFFCKRVIEEKLDISMHVMTRFGKEFTYKNCKILSKAGVKFLAIGLESASTRLNNLMKKYEEDYNVDDFQNFIDNCLNNKINIHLYTIYGFPTETKQEIDMTSQLLVNNINFNNFFSFTAGTFAINRGTEVYINPEKFNINILLDEKGEETHITTYNEDSKKQREEFLKDEIYRLYKNLFFGKLSSNIDIRNFWHFVEESKIFHMLKLTNINNPFLSTFRKIYVDYKKILMHDVKRFKYIQFDKSNLIITNWITKESIKFSSKDFYFLYNYDNSISFQENIDVLSYNGDNFKMFCEKLILVKS